MNILKLVNLVSSLVSDDEAFSREIQPPLEEARKKGELVLMLNDMQYLNAQMVVLEIEEIYKSAILKYMKEKGLM